MELSTLIQFAAQFGVPTALLILFVWYFINRDKKRDEQLTAQNAAYEQRISEQFKSFYERETSMLAESARREELIIKNADERERIIRAEAERRENIIITNAARREDFLSNYISDQSLTLKKISETLRDIHSTYSQLEQKVNNIEELLKKGAAH